MTEQQLDILRMKLKIEVLQVLLHGLYTGLANTSPTVAQVWRDRFAALRQEHDKIVIQNFPPEYSDLVAAEYQEALDDVLSSIEKGFKK